MAQEIENVEDAGSKVENKFVIIFILNFLFLLWSFLFLFLGLVFLS